MTLHRQPYRVEGHHMSKYGSFAVAATERAVKAFCATLLAFLPANGLDAVPDLNWGDMLTLSGYAALASLLFSVVSSQFGGTGPSLANEVITQPAEDDDGYGAIELLVVVILALLAVYVLLAIVD